MYGYLKKGQTYPIDKLNQARAHIGKCSYCSAPVLFSPVVKVMINHFKVIAFQVIDSKEEMHHCFKYKIENERIYKNF